MEVIFQPNFLDSEELIDKWAVVWLFRRTLSQLNNNIILSYGLYRKAGFKITYDLLRTGVGICGHDRTTHFRAVPNILSRFDRLPEIKIYYKRKGKSI